MPLVRVTPTPSIVTVLLEAEPPKKLVWMLAWVLTSTVVVRTRGATPVPAPMVFSATAVVAPTERRLLAVAPDRAVEAMLALAEKALEADSAC